MNAALQAEFRALRHFSCDVWYGQRVPPLAAESFDGYERELRCVHCAMCRHMHAGVCSR